jgi:hypothetical protein
VVGFFSSIGQSLFPAVAGASQSRIPVEHPVRIREVK